MSLGMHVVYDVYSCLRLAPRVVDTQTVTSRVEDAMPFGTRVTCGVWCTPRSSVSAKCGGRLCPQTVSHCMEDTMCVCGVYPCPQH